jgi:hypothetical protein
MRNIIKELHQELKDIDKTIDDIEWGVVSLSKLPYLLVVSIPLLTLFAMIWYPFKYFTRCTKKDQ